jgi:hypothetical protein
MNWIPFSASCLPRLQVGGREEEIRAIQKSITKKKELTHPQHHIDCLH